MKFGFKREEELSIPRLIVQKQCNKQNLQQPFLLIMTIPLYSLKTTTIFEINLIATTSLERLEYAIIQ